MHLVGWFIWTCYSCFAIRSFAMRMLCKVIYHVNLIHLVHGHVWLNAWRLTLPQNHLADCCQIYTRRCVPLITSDNSLSCSTKVWRIYKVICSCAFVHILSISACSQAYVVVTGGHKFHSQTKSYNVLSSQKTQLYLNMVHGVVCTINYMFRPLYWPSSGLH